MVSRKASSMTAGAVIFFVGMLISRILGLVRDNLLLQTFGNTDTTGAYKLAFMVPDLFYYLLAGGAMSAAFIPVFTGYLSKGEDHEAHQVGSTIATFLMVSMIICVAFIVLFAPQLVHLLPASQKFTPEAFNLTVSLTRIMCVMLIFTAQSGHLTGILNSYKHFVAPVVVWSVYTLCTLLGITVLSKLALFGGSPAQPNIHGVAYGVVLGAVMLAAIQFPVAIRYGFRFHILFDFAHAGVKRVFQLFVPVMFSLALSQVNILFIPIVMGASFGMPAVTDISNANKIVMLPFSLFAAAIGTAVFPTMSQQVVSGLHKAFRDTLGKSMRVLLLVLIPCAIIMIALAAPICYLLYGGGKFDHLGLQASAYVLALFAWAVLGLGLAQVVNRAFYSLHDTITPTIVSVIMVVCNFGLAWFLAGHSGFRYGSVAISTTITSTLSTLILIELIRRRLGGIGGRGLLLMTGKVLLASLVMGLVVYMVAIPLAPTIDGLRIVPTFDFVGGATHHFLQAPDLPFSIPDAENVHLNLTHMLRLRLAVQVGFSMLLGFLVYVGLLKLLRVEELNIVTDRLLAKFRRRQTASV